MENILESNLFKRLEDYETDFKYSKALFFSAADRILEQSEKKLKVDRILNRVSVLISVLMFSTLVSLLTELFDKNLILIIVFGLLSFTEICISVFQLNNPPIGSQESYRSRAEEYNDLFKTTNNLIAKVKDKRIIYDELDMAVAQIAEKDNKLRAVVLPISKGDYENAKSLISQGSYDYNNTKLLSQNNDKKPA